METNFLSLYMYCFRHLFENNIAIVKKQSLYTHTLESLNNIFGLKISFQKKFRNL